MQSLVLIFRPVPPARIDMLANGYPSWASPVRDGSLSGISATLNLSCVYAISRLAAASMGNADCPGKQRWQMQAGVAGAAAWDNAGKYSSGTV